jgi:hypothetical protein
MGPERALQGLEEFGGNDPRSMRSVTAYLIGCLKKYQEVGAAPQGFTSIWLTSGLIQAWAACHQMKAGHGVAELSG